MTQPLFEVVTPAAAGAARRLTTVEKVKAALRIADSANDALITSIIDGVSSDCAREARLARAGVDRPDASVARTLRATWACRGRESLHRSACAALEDANHFGFERGRSWR